MPKQRILAQAAIAVLCLCVAPAQAQTAAVSGPAPAASARHGERLVKFSGALKDRLGRPLTGVVGLTFALYKDQQGGAPLWLETQNAELDERGRYTLLLGATQSEGLPLELFTSGEPRWLGVQVILPGVEEEPRVLLVSVPYALKAADAETLGGKPLSAFLLVPEANSTAAAGTAAPPTAIPKPPLATSGTANYIARFQDTTNLINSALFQDNSGNVGLGTTTPAPYHFVSKFTPTAAGDFQIRAESNDGPFLGLLSGAVAGSYNSLVNTYDNALIFGGTGGPGTGGLTIGPWSLGAAGLRMDGSGNVGIGTASPTQKLHVFSNSGVSRILIDSPLDQQAALAFGASGAAPSWFLYRAGNYDLKLFDTADRVTFQAGGNVGIGTTTPAQKLEVAGNLKVSGTGNGIVFSDGTIQTTACGVLYGPAPEARATGRAGRAASGTPMGEGIGEDSSGCTAAASLQQMVEEQRFQIERLQSEVESLKQRLDSLLGAKQ